jgi:hypothetical protein
VLLFSLEKTDLVDGKQEAEPELSEFQQKAKGRAEQIFFA